MPPSIIEEIDREERKKRKNLIKKKKEKEAILRKEKEEKEIKMKKEEEERIAIMKKEEEERIAEQKKLEDKRNARLKKEEIERNIKLQNEKEERERKLRGWVPNIKNKIEEMLRKDDSDNFNTLPSNFTTKPPIQNISNSSDQSSLHNPSMNLHQNTLEGTNQERKAV